MTSIQENQIEEKMGEGVRVAIHRLPHCGMELHVAVAPELRMKARKEAVKRVNREVTMPGFRKGRAPEEFVVRKFPQEVEKEQRQVVADLAFVEAQRVAKTPLLNGNSRVTFDIKVESETQLELVFRFETEPTVPSVDISLFNVEPVKVMEVEEKHIDEAIRQMAFFHAEWKTIEDRPVQEGDFVIIDVETLEGDKWEKVFNQVRFEVIPEKMAAWMRRLLIGQLMGAVTEGMSEPDADASEQDKIEFKPKQARVRLLKVETAALPPIDDAFAQQVGAENVAAMRNLVADVLRRQVSEQKEQKIRAQVNAFLMKTYDFDLPSSLVQSEEEHRWQEILRDPQAKKAWENMSEEEKSKRREDVRLDAKASLRLFYLARQIVRDAKLPVTQQEIQDKAISLHQSMHRETEEIAKEEYAVAFSNVLLTKAQDFVMAHAKQA